MISDIPEGFASIILSIISLIGNVIVAYIGFMRDRLTRSELSQQIVDTGGNPASDEHVVELVNQTDNLHRVCRKLLLAKGRTEQAERERLMLKAELPPGEETIVAPKIKRTGVIRRNLGNNQH